MRLRNGERTFIQWGNIHLCNLWQKINSALLLIVRFCTPLLCFTTLLSPPSAMILHNNTRSVAVLFVAAVVLGGWNTRSGKNGREQD